MKDSRHRRRFWVAFERRLDFVVDLHNSNRSHLMEKSSYSSDGIYPESSGLLSIVRDLVDQYQQVHRSSLMNLHSILSDYIIS